MFVRSCYHYAGARTLCRSSVGASGISRSTAYCQLLYFGVTEDSSLSAVSLWVYRASCASVLVSEAGGKLDFWRLFCAREEMSVVRWRCFNCRRFREHTREPCFCMCTTVGCVSHGVYFVRWRVGVKAQEHVIGGSKPSRPVCCVIHASVVNRAPRNGGGMGGEEVGRGAFVGTLMQY